MKKEIESIVLVNEDGQRLRIYKVENIKYFCIGLEDGDDHFVFTVENAKDIIGAIDSVVNSFK